MDRRSRQTGGEEPKRPGRIRGLRGFSRISGRGTCAAIPLCGRAVPGCSTARLEERRFALKCKAFSRGEAELRLPGDPSRSDGPTLARRFNGGNSGYNRQRREAAE